MAILAAVVWLQTGSDEYGRDAGPEPGSGRVALTPGVIEQAFERRESDVLVLGRGRVVRVLEDDLDGARHQRFVLALDSGITVLIAHNIDIAPRVGDLQIGESVLFRGEYEWNDRGGVIHWTHHDPDGIHEDGWLEYAGRRYE